MHHWKDLVREQLKIASGQDWSLPKRSENPRFIAVESEFTRRPNHKIISFPDIGTLDYLFKRPQGPGIRIEMDLKEGMTIPIYYDL